MINWSASKSEVILIEKIVTRFHQLTKKNPQHPYFERLDVAMDVTACHLNNNDKKCFLDLMELLGFSDDDFMHDVYGIVRHIDRKTGKLKNCFYPRSAR